MTSAAKPKRRPPFTTFATRLMWTSLSTNSLGSSRSRERRSRSRGSRAIGHDPLKLQSSFARGIAERLDAAVVEVAAAIEYDFGDALLDRTLGHELADRLPGIELVAGLSAAA